MIHFVCIEKIEAEWAYSSFYGKAIIKGWIRPKDFNKIGREKPHKSFGRVAQKVETKSSFLSYTFYKWSSKKGLSVQQLYKKILKKFLNIFELSHPSLILSKKRFTLPSKYS
jgi:hypothetical protein